jgi:hydroxymethylpyrimidine/phosphomethylpyrimidine kinase
LTAIALTIAGSDSGGGAGIQADLKTFAALGVYGCSVITALTAQNTRGVTGIHDVPPAFVEAQFNAVIDDIAVKSIKIGMLANAEVIAAVARCLARAPGIPVVLDPVMVAASGDPLLRADAIEALKVALFPLAAVVTPNLHEAALLTGLPLAANETAMRGQGMALLASGAAAVLMKGGHGSGAESVDLLITLEGETRLSAPRIATENVHGTGCTLSSAIAAGLAKGLPLREAISEAKAYITTAIAASSDIEVGHGHGPAHHFHAFWPQA